MALNFCWCNLQLPFFFFYQKAFFYQKFSFFFLFFLAELAVISTLQFNLSEKKRLSDTFGPSSILLEQQKQLQWAQNQLKEKSILCILTLKLEHLEDNRFDYCCSDNIYLSPPLWLSPPIMNFYGTFTLWAFWNITTGISGIFIWGESIEYQTS